MISSIPTEVQQGVVRILNQHASPSVVLQHFSFTGGGCINAGGKLITSAGDFFLKWNDAKKFPSMFQAEAKGLNLLRAANVIAIPSVIGFGLDDTFQFILLEFIESKGKSNDFWTNLGRQLAALHHVTRHEAGLDHSNYIGSLQQINRSDESWLDFFIHHRLDAQVKLLKAPDPSLYKQFDQLYKKLPSLLVDEPHSLLHGDLWSGNLISTNEGKPCLIDPAVYYGNREAEISFTLLFGSFDDSFYSSYIEAFPLQHGFQQRVPLYNLYPLLVHANLFGEGYLAQVKSILKKFV